MAASSHRERLTRLADLASRSDVPAGELTDEVADLLADWPEKYPQNMREPFEALLEKSLNELDAEARARLAGRFASRDGIPLTVLNALFFDAGKEVQNTILARNAAVSIDPVPECAVDERALLTAAAKSDCDFASALSEHFTLQHDVAAAIVTDDSAFGLAIACIGANCRRATFSALAVLTRPDIPYKETFARLATYDLVPQEGARGFLQFWRSRANGTPKQPTEDSPALSAISG